MNRLCLSLLLCLPLAACQRTPEPPAATPPPADTQADVPANADQPTGDVPPATAPPGTLPPRLQQGGQALARWDGYGDVRFGMDAAQVRAGWGGQLDGAPADGPDGADACYYLRPKWAAEDRSFGFMMEAGKLVRYDSTNPKELAPGGGRVGMPAGDITTVYAGHVEAQPHKYEEGAQYLRVTQDGQAGVLVFETDASGQVTRWRVGLPPQVDYVEGCS